MKKQIEKNKIGVMKLYTEEQLIKAIKLAQECEHDCGGVYFDYTETEIINDLMPIELPSDEEIGKLREEHIPIDEEDMWSERFYFTIGAKTMRDKIQGGNNEQQ